MITIAYQNHSYEDYKKMLISFGLPDYFAEVLANSDVGASQGDLESSSNDLTTLIGRPTTPLSEALKAALK